MSITYIKLQCEDCGREFLTTKMQPYCTNCRGNKRHRNQKRMSELNRIAKLAAEHGMTYGKYVEKYGV